MREQYWWERLRDWAEMIPIRLAYRIIWAMAAMGNRTAREVYKAMWDANLSLPKLGDN